MRRSREVLYLQEQIATLQTSLLEVLHYQSARIQTLEAALMSHNWGEYTTLVSVPTPVAGPIQEDQANPNPEYRNTAADRLTQYANSLGIPGEYDDTDGLLL